jgi:MFS transporter, PAT family, beta-lactamase induction signal transducer AmpG
VSLAERRWLRLFTLCALYVAQGIPWGFMATTLPAYLTKHGVTDVGTVLAMTTLPYTFKWIWGPIIDAFTIPRFGRRRPWILFAQSMMALTVAAMVTFDVTHEVALLVQMIFIHTVFNALQDVSVDALAVDLLPEEERGRANGFMYGSKYLGGALGGFGMAFLITQASLRLALLVQTATLVAIMMLPLFLRERSGPPPAREPVRAIGAALVQAFSLRSTLVTALLMLAGNFAIGMVNATAYQLFIGKLGWEVDEYTAISGGWGLVIGGTCAGLTGMLTDKVGRRPVAAIAALALGAGWIGFALLKAYWHEPNLVYVAGFYEGACQAIWATALIALCMDVAWPRIGASQFSAYMALSNFSTTLGYQFSASAMGWFEFEGVYMLAGGVQIAAALLLWPIDPGETRRKLPLPPGTKPNVLALGALGVLLVFLIAMTVRATARYL